MFQPADLGLSILKLKLDSRALKELSSLACRHSRFSRHANRQNLADQSLNSGVLNFVCSLVLVEFRTLARSLATLIEAMARISKETRIRISGLVASEFVDEDLRHACLRVGLVLVFHVWVS